MNRGYAGALILLLVSWVTLIAFLIFMSFVVTLRLGKLTGIFDFAMALAIGLTLIYVWYLLLKAIFRWARSKPSR
ncbi:MAG: hypothetical protein ACP5T5_02155 [Thermoprotei archaeon]|nr:hypothetical protein [TACK group archaeon]